MKSLLSHIIKLDRQKSSPQVVVSNSNSDGLSLSIRNLPTQKKNHPDLRLFLLGLLMAVGSVPVMPKNVLASTASTYKAGWFADRGSASNDRVEDYAVSIANGTNVDISGKISLLPPLTDCAGSNCPIPYPNTGTYLNIQGRDNSYAVFIGGDLTITNAAEVEGGIFVGGNFNLNKTGGVYNTGWVGVGSFVVPDPLQDYLTVGGNINIPNGATLEIGGLTTNSGDSIVGNLRHKGSIPSSGINTSGSIIADPGLNLSTFQAEITNWQSKSQCLANLSQSANVSVTDESWRVVVRSTDGASGNYIININQDLAGKYGAIGLEFANFPNDATILINVTDTGGDNQVRLNLNDLTRDGSSIGSFTVPSNDRVFREKILWNFPNSVSRVSFEGFAQFQGSVVIANAASETIVDVPGMNGRFLSAGNVTHTKGGSEFHNYPFRGILPTSCATPTNPVGFSGTVFNDADGNKLQSVGGETYQNADITAVVLNSSDLVVGTANIDAQGGYSLNNIAPGTYTVKIIKTPATPLVSGVAIPTAMDVLPIGWIVTGENNNGTIDPSPDRQQTIVIGTNSLTGINFGIKQVPNTKAKLVLAKRITAIKDGVTGIITNYSGSVPDPNSIDLANYHNCNWPTATGTAGACTNTYLAGATTATAPKVKPGDEIEYTIYYLNGGANKASARVCDQLNPNLTFQLQDGSGIGWSKGGAAMLPLTNTGTDGDKGQLTDATVSDCNIPNNGGTEVVVVDVGDATNPLMGSTGAGIPTTSYGYIRFKALVLDGINKVTTPLPLSN